MFDNKQGIPFPFMGMPQMPMFMPFPFPMMPMQCMNGQQASGGQLPDGLPFPFMNGMMPMPFPFPFMNGSMQRVPDAIPDGWYGWYE